MTLSSLQYDLINKIRSGREHKMIRGIIKHTFDEETRKVKEKSPPKLSKEDLFELSIIYKRLQEIGLPFTSIVLRNEINEELYSLQTLNEIVDYPVNQRLNSSFSLKSGKKLPDITPQAIVENVIPPLSSLSEIREHSEKLAEEIIKSHKIIQERKKLELEDYYEDEEEPVIEAHESVKIDDPPSSNCSEQDESAESVEAESSSEQATSPSTSEEETTAGWTRGLFASTMGKNQNSEKILSALPNKDSRFPLNNLPPLNPNRLPPITRAPLNIPPLAKLEKTPSVSSVDSQTSDEERKISVVENKKLFNMPKKDTLEPVDDAISGELEELTFEDLPGDFSDSAESISF